jgi:methionine sulfoxide reductase heme-binding subunit
VSNNVLWYTARGTGITTLVLLTLVVALGIGSRSGREMFGLPRFAVAVVHRNAALLSVVLLAIHITTLLLDAKAHLHITDVVIPFMASYRPFWQGLGTLAFELILALVVTGLLRNRMSERVFRAVHWLAYLCWPVAVAHGLGTGTDRGTVWMLSITGVCIALVVSAIGWRVAPRFEEHSDVRRPLVRPPSALSKPAASQSAAAPSLVSAGRTR